MVFETLKNNVKPGRVYFVICPQQGPKIEGVVLHSVGMLGKEKYIPYD